MINGGAVVGYVANSIYTKVLGTSSAGYINRDFERSIRAKVKCITHDTVIAEVLLEEQM